jgi:hypothetical protein
LEVTERLLVFRSRLGGLFLLPVHVAVPKADKLVIMADNLFFALKEGRFQKISNNAFIQFHRLDVRRFFPFKRSRYHDHFWIKSVLKCLSKVFNSAFVRVDPVKKDVVVRLSVRVHLFRPKILKVIT